MPNSPRRSAIGLVTAIVLLIGAACSKKEPAPASAKSASTDSVVPLPLIQCAADGLWRPCNLLDRLVHAGVGAKVVETDTTRVPFFSPPGINYKVGKSSLLIAFYFKDSLSAKKSWIALDTIRLRPKTDTISPWPSTVSPIRSANVIVAFFGTSYAQLERVSLALRAGLPAPAKTH